MSEWDHQHLRRCVDLFTEAVETGDQPLGSFLVSVAIEALFEI